VQGLEQCRKLVYLNLARNKLTRLDNIPNVTLKTLVAEENYIDTLNLGGCLNNLINLEELNVAHQYTLLNLNLSNIPVGNINNKTNSSFNSLSHADVQSSIRHTKLSVEPLNFPNLQILNCSRNRIEDSDFSSLGGLQNLRTLNVDQNELANEDNFIHTLSKLRLLENIDFRGNLVEKVAKIRDKCILTLGSLSKINDKEINDRERLYIQRLQNLKDSKK